MRCLVDCYWSAIHFWALALVIWWALMLPWEADPPESAVPLTNADTTQHSLLVHHVLPQELADNVSAQTEAHHDQLRLRVRPLNVAYHGGKLPCATWMGERWGEQLIYDTAQGQSAAPRSAVPLKVPLAQGPWKAYNLFNSRCFAFWLYISRGLYCFFPKINWNWIKIKYFAQLIQASDVLFRENLTIGKHAGRGQFDVGKSS